MGGYFLLQVLAVSLLSEIALAQVNTRHFYRPRPGDASAGLLFPSNVAVNRFVERLPPIRALNRPKCSFNSRDPSAPCSLDEEYDDNVKNLVNRLLQQSRSVNEIVNDPMLKVILNDSLTPAVNPALPSTRFGGPRETPVCVAGEELIFPQRAKTPKDDWVFIVNQDNIKQALRVETCLGEGRPCQLGIVQRGEVSTICRQKYVYRRMLTVGSNNIEPEEVLMPSCCVCYSRRETFDILEIDLEKLDLEKKNSFDVSSRVGPGNETEESGTTGDVSSAAPSPSLNPQPAGAQPINMHSNAPVGSAPTHSINFAANFHNNRRRSSNYHPYNPYYVG